MSTQNVMHYIVAIGFLPGQVLAPLKIVKEFASPRVRQHFRGNAFERLCRALVSEKLDNAPSTLVAIGILCRWLFISNERCLLCRAGCRCTRAVRSCPITGLQQSCPITGLKRRGRGPFPAAPNRAGRAADLPTVNFVWSFRGWEGGRFGVWRCLVACCAQASERIPLFFALTDEDQVGECSLGSWSLLLLELRDAAHNSLYRLPLRQPSCLKSMEPSASSSSASGTWLEGPRPISSSSGTAFASRPLRRSNIV